MLQWLMGRILPWLLWIPPLATLVVTVVAAAVAALFLAAVSNIVEDMVASKCAAVVHLGLQHYLIQLLLYCLF
jgi:hypothetical protein